MSSFEQTRPSEVFGALWRYWAIKTDAGVEDFLLLAETWAQIRELEEIAARERRAEQQYRQAAEAFAAYVARADGKKDPSTPLRSAQDDNDGRAEPVSDSDTQPAPEEKPETAQKAAFAARKAADIQRLEELRAAGFTLQQIADAARGLKITEVTDALGRKKLSVTTWSKIEKAIDALTLRAAVEEGE